MALSRNFGEDDVITDMDMDNHNTCLQQLCRICANILTGGYSCEVKEHVESIQKVFHIDINNNIPNVNPPKFCHKCYSVVASAQKADSIVTYSAFIWREHTLRNCVTCGIRRTKSKGGRPAKRSKKNGRPHKVVSVSDMMNVSSCRQITPEMELAVANVSKVKSQHDASSNVIQIKTGGSHPMTIAPVIVVRKESHNVTPRTIRARSKRTKELMEIMVGSSSEAVAIQTSHIIKSYGSKQREDILKNFKHTIYVPDDIVASTKSVLALTWNSRDMRLWLSTFKVNLAPEGKVHGVVKNWVGDGLRCEEIPATFLKEKKIIVKLVPWCYIFNLVGYVLHYLNNLQSTGLFTDPAFIPSNDVFLKIGGDHGGGSFKMSFQIANTDHPNKVENTVLFSVMEAKDSKANLLLCLQRFKTHCKI